MGCIQSPKVIRIQPIESSKKETSINLVRTKNKDKDPVEEEAYNFSDEEYSISHYTLGQSQLPIKAKIKNNEVVFL